MQFISGTNVLTSQIMANVYYMVRRMPAQLGGEMGVDRRPLPSKMINCQQ